MYLQVRVRDEDKKASVSAHPNPVIDGFTFSAMFRDDLESYFSGDRRPTKRVVLSVRNTGYFRDPRKNVDLGSAVQRGATGINPSRTTTTKSRTSGLFDSWSLKM